MTGINGKNTPKVCLHDQEMVERESDGTNISANSTKKGTARMDGGGA